MRQARVSAINIFPIKSLRGCGVESAVFDRRGPRWDRRWMVVDATGRFVTQRQEHRMALVRVRLTAHSLVLEGPGMTPLAVPLEAAGDPMSVQVWDSRVTATDMGRPAAGWLSRFLGRPVRLVFMPEAWRRDVDPDYAPQGATVGFADGFPILLISQASLDDLNDRLADPVPMIRFRPNLVVSGTDPFAEDGWREVRIGPVRMSVVKPCGRCAIPCIDPDSGEAGDEPLRTLATYRRSGREVLFGQNLVHREEGEIRIGDAVEVLA